MKLTTIFWRSIIAAALASGIGCSIGSDTASDGPAPFSRFNDHGVGQQAGNRNEGSTSLLPSAMTIAAGTPISVRLQDRISSATAHPGDRFSAVLEEPLLSGDGQTLAPLGAMVTGRVVAARQSGRLHDSGYLRIALTSIEADGKVVPIQSSSLLTPGQTRNKRAVEMIGGHRTKRILAGPFIGGKDALPGSASGAGAGTGVALMRGKKDVGFGSDRPLTFRLKQPVRLG